MSSDPDRSWAERLLVFVLLAAMTVRKSTRASLLSKCGSPIAEFTSQQTKVQQVYLARLLFSFRRSGLVLSRGPKPDAASPRNNGARDRSDDSEGDVVH